MWEAAGSAGSRGSSNSSSSSSNLGDRDLRCLRVTAIRDPSSCYCFIRSSYLNDQCLHNTSMVMQSRAEPSRGAHSERRIVCWLRKVDNHIKEVQTPCCLTSAACLLKGQSPVCPFSLASSDHGSG
jgi:hypothetical protein